MTDALPVISARAVYNPQAAYAQLSESQRQILNEQGLHAAKAELTFWPDYAPTPLQHLTGLAARAGIAGLYYKDEAQRFGLGSFKALGGAYAVRRLLGRELARQGVADVTTADLLAGRWHERCQGITVSCATDGNHGRSVAWGAQLFGCRCVIYIHATVSEGREQAIARYGAEVVRTAGHYDDAVRQAAEDAEHLGRWVVSDTSYEGYTDVPKDVMQGYTVMVDEAIQQLPSDVWPTHVFIQGGVGGLPAAVCAPFWERYGERRPQLVVVEPERADCIYQSIKHGQRCSASGDLDTLMAGLACGEVSLLAWEILRTGAAAALTVNDQAAVDCMRLLAQGIAGDAPIVAGESAVAGLAGVLATVTDTDLRQRLGVDQHSRILLFGSEGDTDPQRYQQLIGYTATQVRNHMMQENPLC